LSVTDEPIEALAGAPEGEIELARVERELAALWAATAPEDPGAEPAVLRACSLNLLVLGGSPDDLEPARAIAAATTLAHPSRILLLAPEAVVRSEPSGVGKERLADAVSEAHASRLTPHASNSVGARISTFCHRLGSGRRHVCCEEITLVARGAAAGRLREAVLPLLVPDLPVVLWVSDTVVSRQSLVASKDVRRTPAGTHDSRLTTDDSPALWELADAVIWSARWVDDRLPRHPHRSQQPAVVDLDWLRLQPWRELTAQLFDSLEHRPLLGHLEAVEIEVAGPGHERPGAGWLWVSWLASRLGWEYQGEAAAAHERRFIGPRGPVTARVSERDVAGLAVGEPLAVRLRVQGRAQPLALERQPAPVPCDLWVTGQGGRCVRLGTRDEAALLSEALGSTVRDRVYEAAWETACRLRAE
jgi:glucose-6-phosphate dehydrogenase assembly protein OpcA